MWNFVVLCVCSVLQKHMRITCSSKMLLDMLVLMLSSSQFRVVVCMCCFMEIEEVHVSALLSNGH